MGFFNFLAHALGIGRYSTYEVKKGDTLSGIALKTMGSADKYPAIFEANRPMLKDPDKIYPGQILRIPRR